MAHGRLGLKPLGFAIRGCIDGFNRKDLLALYCITIDKLAIIQKKATGQGVGFPSNVGKISI